MRRWPISTVGQASQVGRNQEVFSGILDNAAGSSQVGIFAGTLITVSSTTPPAYMATVDLQLQGGQITVQGFLDSSKSTIVHAVMGGTGIYRGARGQFSFTEPSCGVLLSPPAGCSTSPLRF
jgi:hypothetical protein